MIIDKIKNREYEMKEIPWFITQSEYESNIEFGKICIGEKWVDNNWNNWTTHHKDFYAAYAEKAIHHGGIILEVGAGPGGGMSIPILMRNNNAHLIMSDICPAVLTEWKRVLESTIKPPNVEYAAVNSCDLPFKDESIDVITDAGGFGNIEGDKFAAIKSAYRVLKKSGCYILSISYVTDEYTQSLPEHAQKVLRKEFPDIFHDFYKDFQNAGYEIETLSTGTWSNENDSSGLADLCRELGVVAVFNNNWICCTK